MAYTKQNFTDGDTLYAYQLSAIEDQMISNMQAIKTLSSDSNIRNGDSCSATIQETDGGYSLTIMNISGENGTVNQQTVLIRHGNDGQDGDSITVDNIEENEDSGGYNIVTFTDGRAIIVRNGIDGRDGNDGKAGYSVYYMSMDVELDKEAIYSVNPANLSEGGLGVKKGDMLISSNGVICVVDDVEPGIVSFHTVANIGGYIRTVNGIAPDENGNVEIDSPDSTQNVDLTGYATEQYVKDYAQPKGNYLTEHQDLSGYAKKSEIPAVPVQSVNGKTGAVSLTASDVGARPNTWIPSATDVGALPNTTKIPAKTSELTNDSGFITGYTETDPTVPAWAKAASKPSYSKSEVGLGNVDNVKQYSASNPPPYPVTSVNGKTGEVTITVPTVPTKVSAFTNDVGYLTEISKEEIVQQVIALLPVYNGEVV